MSLLRDLAENSLKFLDAKPKKKKDKKEVKRNPHDNLHAVKWIVESKVIVWKIEHNIQAQTRENERVSRYLNHKSTLFDLIYFKLKKL